VAGDPSACLWDTIIRKKLLAPCQGTASRWALVSACCFMWDSQTFPRPLPPKRHDSWQPALINPSGLNEAISTAWLPIIPNTTNKIYWVWDSFEQKENLSLKILGSGVPFFWLKKGKRQGTVARCPQWTHICLLADFAQAAMWANLDRGKLLLSRKAIHLSWQVALLAMAAD
jgi:hypothetical protein